VMGLPPSYTFTASDAGSHTFTNVILKTAGNQTINATDSVTSTITGTSAGVDVAALPAKELRIITRPSSGIIAGQPFTVVVAAEDPYDNVDPTFNGNVTISLANDPGFTTTVRAQNGVATFTGLMLGTAFSDGTIEASASGLSAATTPPIIVLPPTPMIISEQMVLTYLKHNKHGKPVGKPVVSFVFQFSTTMNPATVGNPNNYQVDWTSTKRVKKKTVPLLHPIGVQSAKYSVSTNLVVLLTSASTKTFAKGGQITVITAPPDGVDSAASVPLTSSDAQLAISAKANGITLD
jgi:hypothetical protein